MRIARFEIGWGGLMYLLVSVFVLALAMQTQANLLFWAFGLMVGALVMSLLGGWYMLRTVEVRRLPPAHGVAGEGLVIRYQVFNRSRWMPVFGLLVGETGARLFHSKRTTTESKEASVTDEILAEWASPPLGWVLHVGPGQSVRSQAVCRPTTRGWLRLHRIVLACTFPFGILERKVEVHAPAAILIYPRLYRIKRRLLHDLSNRDPSGRQFVEQAGGAEEFYGLREYRRGDSLKTVDWKHTARLGQLVARELTQPSSPRVMVLLDLNRHLPPNSEPDEKDTTLWDTLIETAIDLAASLICDAHFHGFQVGLEVRGVARCVYPVHHSLPHRSQLLEALARLNPKQRHESPAMTVTLAPSVVVTPDETGCESTYGARLALSAARLNEYVRPGRAGAALLRSPAARTARHRLTGKEVVA